MKKTLLVLVLLLSIIPLKAQTVLVIDQSTLQPIAKVLLFNSQKTVSATTNNEGKADISAFDAKDTIHFTHISYFTESYSFAQVKDFQFIVPLFQKSISLYETVVSASRFEEKAKDVAQQVQVIDAKELAFVSLQTTADVLQNSGNILVQKSQLGGGSPIIRGFEGNKVLMVVDGVRMNNAIYRGGHLQNSITLDNSLLEKVEIVYGPGSVVYGSDALGGVMHFHSKKPLLADTGKLRLHVNAFTRYSSASSEGSGHVDFNLGSKRFASLSSLTFSRFGDLRQGSRRNPFYGDWGKRTFYVERVGNQDSMFVNPDPNLQKQSGYDQIDLFQKFLFQQNKNLIHELNLQYSSSSNIPRYDRLTQTRNGVARYAEWYYGPQNRFFAAYSLSSKAITRLYQEAKLTLAYQNIRESRYSRLFNRDTLEIQVEELNILSLNIDLAKKMGKHEIRYGLDAWYNAVKSRGNGKNILDNSTFALISRYPNGGSNMQNVAVYLTHAWEISEKLIINDGLRYSLIGLNARFADKSFFPFPYDEIKQNNQALNGNIGLIYMPNKSWRYTVLTATGFRAPNVDDLSKVFESVPGKIIIPNPDIKPEYTWNLSGGATHSFTDKISLGTDVFYTLYTNAITTREGQFNGQDSLYYDGQMSKVILNDNVARAYIYGLSAYFQADISPQFSMVHTLNYTYGRLITDSIPYPLDHIPPVFGRSSFQLKLKQFKGEFFLVYSGAKASKDYNLIGEDNAQFSADPVNGYTPAWFTLNVRTAYQFNKHLRLQVALENILDKNYRVFASNIGAPGRNLVLTLRGNF
ncbi:MAG TPA: TonB-dependent receptor [Bacteroidetes bacterium]|nr:TonB-dependent receptor [Bacteroidota bacterium]